jgi:hypothetical protein
MSGNFTYQPVDPQAVSARADAIIQKRPGQFAAIASAVSIKTLASVGSVGQPSRRPTDCS